MTRENGDLAVTSKIMAGLILAFIVGVGAWIVNRLTSHEELSAHPVQEQRSKDVQKDIADIKAEQRVLTLDMNDIKRNQEDMSAAQRRIADGVEELLSR